MLRDMQENLCFGLFSHMKTDKDNISYDRAALAMKTRKNFLSKLRACVMNLNSMIAMKNPLSFDFINLLFRCDTITLYAIRYSHKINISQLMSIARTASMRVGRESGMRLFGGGRKESNRDTYFSISLAMRCYVIN